MIKKDTKRSWIQAILRLFYSNLFCQSSDIFLIWLYVLSYHSNISTVSDQPFTRVVSAKLAIENMKLRLQMNLTQQPPSLLRYAERPL